MRRGTLVGPVILITVGVLFLLNNIGWDFPVAHVLRTFWPLILVAVGLFHIAASFIGRGSLPAGIIVLTLGVLFSVQKFWGVRFHDTWPVLLIAIGAIGLLRAILGPVAFTGRYMKGARR